jgi:transcriptional regulator with PAS, ATPase and Fis domain
MGIAHFNSSESVEEANDRLADDASNKHEHWREQFPEFVGRSPAIKAILKLISKIAGSNSSVLILGESGTGKELVASSIHRLSERRYKAFVAINCSAIPEDLLEAELFGHEKGAFTGADRKRIGHFGLAEGGTLFLDEIGDMTPRLQSKILRVLQEKQYTPIGSNLVKSFDVRVIAATNKNLEAAVKANEFRLDLYYRLNVLPIRLPTLRERKSDIELLLEHFCEQLSRIHLSNPKCWFDESAILALEEYSWPGNIRQLQNLVERLVITHGSPKISKEDLPYEYLENDSTFEDLQKTESKPTHHQSHLSNQLPHEGIDLNRYMEDLETILIQQALEKTNNNKSQASKLLGLNRTTLVEKLKKRKTLKESELP